jgi:hypothetical protein
MRTQKDWPTPNTKASKEIILFPAALYTPAMAAPTCTKTSLVFEKYKIIFTLTQ